MGTKSNWGDAHSRLKRLYEQRAQDITQKEFGSRYGIGSQSMVAQYVNGIRPLNYEAAAKFARGLNCTIYDISPEMADAIKEDILPVLGRALRRAAALACFALIPLTAPTHVEAANFARSADQLCIMSNLRRRLRRALEAMAALFGTGAAAACTTIIDEHTAPPADWPALEVSTVRVGFLEVQRLCSPARANMSVAGWLWSFGVIGQCVLIDFDANTCTQVRPIDETDGDDHEVRFHCTGHDHVGESTLRNAWAQHKAIVAGRAVAGYVR